MKLRTEEVVVGDKNYVLTEFTCLKRNALLDMVGSFTFADILKSIMPILDELNIKLDDGEDGQQLQQLIKLGLQNENIWGGLVSCLITVLRIGPDIICLSVENLDEESEEYIKNNLTVSQEPTILSKIIELNALPSTVKNYKALIVKVKDLMKN